MFHLFEEHVRFPTSMRKFKDIHVTCPRFVFHVFTFTRIRQTFCQTRVQSILKHLQKLPPSFSTLSVMFRETLDSDFFRIWISEYFWAEKTPERNGCSETNSITWKRVPTSYLSGPIAYTRAEPKPIKISYLLRNLLTYKTNRTHTMATSLATPFSSKYESAVETSEHTISGRYYAIGSSLKQAQPLFRHKTGPDLNRSLCDVDQCGSKTNFQVDKYNQPLKKVGTKISWNHSW